MITSIPRYDDQDNDIGVEEVIELPAIPVQYPRKDQARLLEAIGNGSDLFEDLIATLNPRLPRDSETYARERSRLSHHLKKIEDMGFITREKSGKTVRFQLSHLGKIFGKVCRAGDRCG
jgi:CRISPR-associated protein Csa3